MNIPNPHVDVIVIGAGISGLIAAKQILDREPTLKVIILEESDRCGGQILTTISNIELGCNWFNHDQKHMIELCQELKIHIVNRTYDKNLRRLWQIDNNGYLTPLIKFELNQFIKYMDLMSMLHSPRDISTDSCSMEAFLCSKLLFEASRNFVRCIVRAATGIETKFISQYEYLVICRSTNGMTNQIECVTGTGNIYTIEPNLSEVIKRLQKRIGNKYIFFNSKVNTIESNGSSVIITTESNDQFHCSVVILTISLQCFQSITFIPSIESPESLLQYYHPIVHQKYQRTRFVAEFMEESTLKNQSLSGSIILHDPLHLICYETTGNLLIGTIFHDGITRTSEQIIRIIKDSLKLCIGNNEQSAIISVWKTWNESIIMNLPVSSSDRIIYGTTHSCTRYRGFLNGAIQTGIRAALLTLSILRPQRIVSQDVYEIQPTIYHKRKFVLLKKLFLAINLKMIIYGLISISLMSLCLWYVYAKF